MTPKDIERIEELAKGLLALRPSGKRLLVALVGAPGSGKSTTAEVLAEALNKAGRKTQVVPMDGFHLDNSILHERGLFARKGAPETFDVDGFKQLIADLKTKDEVSYPTFNRAEDRSVPNSGHVGAACQAVVVEGNYLMLDGDGWRDLAGEWDYSVFLDVPDDVLLARLVQRWLDNGMEPEAARKRAEDNDMRNARLIRAKMLTPDAVL